MEESAVSPETTPTEKISSPANVETTQSPELISKSSSSRPRRQASQHKGWIHGRYEPKNHVFNVNPIYAREELGEAYVQFVKESNPVNSPIFSVSNKEIHEVYRISLKASLKMKERERRKLERRLKLK